MNVPTSALLKFSFEDSRAEQHGMLSSLKLKRRPEKAYRE